MMNEQADQQLSPDGGTLAEQIDLHRWKAEVQTFFAQVRQDLHYLAEATKMMPVPPQAPAAPQAPLSPPPQYPVGPATQPEYGRIRRYGE